MYHQPRKSRKNNNSRTREEGSSTRGDKDGWREEKEDGKGANLRTNPHPGSRNLTAKSFDVNCPDPWGPKESPRVSK